jgi:uncharacterized protein (DUF1499 family)
MSMMATCARAKSGRRLAAGLSALLWATTLHAESPPSIPEFQYRESCKTTPNARVCGQLEEETRAEIEAIWNQVSPAKKRECIERTFRVVPGGSYLTLRTCIVGG